MNILNHLNFAQLELCDCVLVDEHVLDVSLSLSANRSNI